MTLVMFSGFWQNLWVYLQYIKCTCIFFEGRISAFSYTRTAVCTSILGTHTQYSPTTTKDTLQNLLLTYISLNQKNSVSKCLTQQMSKTIFLSMLSMLISYRDESKGSTSYRNECRLCKPTQCCNLVIYPLNNLSDHVFY